MGGEGLILECKVNKLMKMILVGYSYHVQIYLLNLKIYSLRTLYSVF